MTGFQTIPNWLRKRVYLTPNRVAVHFNGQEITFQALYEKTKEAAEKIHSAGVQKGDHVAVLLKNHLDMVVILHALQLLGCPAVLLNGRLQANELIFQITDSRAQYLISEADFTDQCSAIESFCSKPILWIEKFHHYGSKSFEEVADFPFDEVCTIMYTSGTTGKPKGVLQTYGNHWSSAIGSALNLGLQENDAWLTAVPLFHISGFSTLIRSVLYGIPIVLFEKFDEEKINQALVDGKATIMSVVSTMLQRMIQQLGSRNYHPSFRCMLTGGGPVPLSLLETCNQKNIPVFQTYGLTETSSQIVTLAPEDSIRKLGSAGKPLFFSDIRIEKDGEIASPNQVGEIVVKGPNVTKGYFNRNEANQTSFTKDGWFHTGDIGYLDEEGFLFVLDRRSDLIISGGENIYPSEIENVIHRHPAIKEVSVVGMEDSFWGQIPVAFFVAKDGCQVTNIELEEFCVKKLAKYKVPKRWIELDEIPKNAANKVLRRVLKEKLNNKKVSRE